MRKPMTLAVSGILASLMLQSPVAMAENFFSRTISQNTIDQICRIVVRGGLSINPDGELNVYDSSNLERNKILEVLPVLNADIGSSGLEVGLGFRVRRGQNKGVTTRIEKYLVGAKLGYNDRLGKSGDNEFFLGGQLRDEFQVSFTRQFVDQRDPAGNIIRDGACEALDITRNTPYFVTEMPIKAMSGKSPSQTVIRELKVGDMVSMRSRMTLVVSAAVASDVGAVGSVGVAVAAGASVLMRGTYEVHVLKTEPTKVHIRVMGIADESESVEVAVVAPGSNFLKAAGLETGVGLIDDAIIDAIQFKVVKLNLNTAELNYGLMDYTADLADAQTAAAFDKTLGVTRILDRAKRGLIAAVTGKSTKVTLNTQELEAIYQADFNSSQKRVTRNLRVTADEKGTSGQFKLDLLLFSFGTSGFVGDTRMTVVDAEGVQTNSVLRQRETKSEFDFLFGLFRSYSRRSVALVSTTDPSFKTLKAQNLMYSYEKMHNVLSAEGVNRFARQLARSVPASLASQINFSAVKLGQKDAVLRYNVVLDKEIMNQLASASFLSPTQVADMYVAYLKAKYPLTQENVATSSPVSPSRVCRGADAVASSICMRVAGRYEGDLMRAADKLSIIMSASRAENERMLALMSLRANEFFNVTGLGFILDQVEKNAGVAALAGNVHLVVELPGTVLQRVGGGRGIDRQFTQALYVQSVLRDSSADLSMEGELIALGIQP